MIHTRMAVDIVILVSEDARRGNAWWKQTWTSHEWGDGEIWRRQRGPYIESADAVNFASCEA